MPLAIVFLAAVFVSSRSAPPQQKFLGEERCVTSQKRSRERLRQLRRLATERKINSTIGRKSQVNFGDFLINHEFIQRQTYFDI